MKKLCMIFMMILIIMMCSGCGNSEKVPRVDILPNHWRFDGIYLPLRENHRFCEVPYGIRETDIGYDIVIHCEKIE